jgi:oligopeptide/dipeptide ABC transporter ATP-binding protein
MELFETVRRKIGSSLFLITHDLGLVANYCDRVYVMYAGKIMETGDIFTLFGKPRHPYTQGLLGCCVRPDQRPTRFATIEGQVPNLISPPPGCRFHPRCPHTMEICQREQPPFFELNGQQAACWLHGEITQAAERST